ncbi:hypothetical protein F5B22DRAFT_641365 [Xylaria bambusicola]|uniref:uncharacterized protein n=1 Tax=Xylaria bambusicola TaxID=326684 RepID=UPI002008A5A6|nr:uncharacterized protein F5B22DRAFT_641365 [Xylaria bambusicola]KAI0526217.1 hypothetical protein F5B22DRAFT_641365 [Xylaria bambusicola]
MDPNLEQRLADIRQEPQDVDEDTQMRFVDAINYKDDTHFDIVDALTHAVLNLYPRLAVRLAMWYIHHDDMDAALAVTLKVLHGNHSETGTEGPSQENLCALIQALRDEVDSGQEEGQ